MTTSAVRSSPGGKVPISRHSSDLFVTFLRQRRGYFPGCRAHRSASSPTTRVPPLPRSQAARVADSRSGSRVNRTAGEHVDHDVPGDLGAVDLLEVRPPHPAARPRAVSDSTISSIPSSRRWRLRLHRPDLGQHGLGPCPFPARSPGLRLAGPAAFHADYAHPFAESVLAGSVTVRWARRALTAFPTAWPKIEVPRDRDASFDPVIVGSPRAGGDLPGPGRRLCRSAPAGSTRRGAGR
jgi:hypothetical protein